MKNAEAIEYIKKNCYGEWCEDDWREAMDMAIEALKSSERTVETIQYNHIAESGRMVERTGKPSQDVSDSDLISRKAAIDLVESFYKINKSVLDVMVFKLKQLPSAQPDRKLIDDCMWKIKQNISSHTAAEGVVAIKYYLEQIYEQIYGEGEKPKWMT